MSLMEEMISLKKERGPCRQAGGVEVEVGRWGERVTGSHHGEKESGRAVHIAALITISRHVASLETKYRPVQAPAAASTRPSHPPPAPCPQTAWRAGRRAPLLAGPPAV